MAHPIQKISNISKKCSTWTRNTFEKNVLWIFILVVTALSLTCRYLVVSYPTNDTVGYILNGWMKEIEEVGFKNFYTINSDYSPLFLFIIACFTLLPKGESVTVNYYSFYLNQMYYLKSVYFLMDLFIALGIYLIIRHVSKDDVKATIGYCIFLCLPIQFTNSALWGNADSMYVCCFIYCLYFLLRRKDHLVWFFFGLALSLKMQSVFILPFLFYIMFSGRLKFYPIYMVFVALLFSFLPSYICGASFKEPFRYFTEQLSGYSQLTLGCANFWHFFSVTNMNSPDSMLNKASTLIGLMMILLLTAIIFIRKIKLTDENIVFTATFLISIVPFFLPHMHERYFYSLEVLILLYAILRNDKTKYILVPLMQLSSGIAYYHYMSGFSIYFLDILKEDSVTLAAIINMVILTVVFIDLMSLDHSPLLRKDKKKAMEKTLTKNLLDD